MSRAYKEIYTCDNCKRTVEKGTSAAVSKIESDDVSIWSSVQVRHFDQMVLSFDFCNKCSKSLKNFTIVIPNLKFRAED